MKRKLKFNLSKPLEYREGNLRKEPMATSTCFRSQKYLSQRNNY